MGSLLAEATSEEETKTEITIDMLDFGYVADCSDVKVLKGILDKLQSGQETHGAMSAKDASCCQLLKEKTQSPKRIKMIRTYHIVHIHIYIYIYTYI